MEATKPCATTKEFLLKSYRQKRAVIRSFLWSFSEFNALNNKVTFLLREYD